MKCATHNSDVPKAINADSVILYEDHEVLAEPLEILTSLELSNFELDILRSHKLKPDGANRHILPVCYFLL